MISRLFIGLGAIKHHHHSSLLIRCSTTTDVWTSYLRRQLYHCQCFNCFHPECRWFNNHFIWERTTKATTVNSWSNDKEEGFYFGKVQNWSFIQARFALVKTKFHYNPLNLILFSSISVLNHRRYDNYAHRNCSSCRIKWRRAKRRSMKWSAVSVSSRSPLQSVIRHDIRTKIFSTCWNRWSLWASIPMRVSYNFSKMNSCWKSSTSIFVCWQPLISSTNRSTLQRRRDFLVAISQFNFCYPKLLDYYLRKLAEQPDIFK